MKRTLALLLTVATMMPLAACDKGAKYTLDKIRLAEGERSWSNPEEEYAGLLDSYGNKECYGSFVVATDTDVVYLYCEDALERDGATPVSQDTIFDIASVSKTFTAVCILQLAEKGQLDINDTLDMYFPEYETGSDITISNLLHMNSGIPDYLNNPDPFWNISGAEAADQKISDILMDRVTDDEFLTALYQAPLEFTPGFSYSYSNTNYRLLAFIIEQLSGMSYCDYVKKNIFDVCGMKSTTSMAVGDLTYVPEDYTEQAEYGFCDENGYPVCPNNSRGDGGIHSNLTDMLAFDRALFGGKLLSEESMSILLTQENGYCCGLVKEQNGYSHSGSSITCSSNNRMIESEEFGHIYIIKLEHSVHIEPVDPSVGALEGTGFIRGTYEDGLYINDFADIHVTIPHGVYPLSDSDIEMENRYFLEAIADCEAIAGDRDYDRAAASATDASYWDAVNEIAIEIDFYNTGSGVTDDPDYTAEELIEDTITLYAVLNEENGFGTERIDSQTVTLGSCEYIRGGLNIDIYGDIGHLYMYSRKINDDLMCLIVICYYTDDAIEDYEALFE
ncbi:MAG: beta-lactamase family protein [Clostridiales bacterium]|nr:beta-lactamase family protein [Clostridiales bacterium]